MDLHFLHLKNESCRPFFRSCDRKKSVRAACMRASSASFFCRFMSSDKKSSRFILTSSSGVISPASTFVLMYACEVRTAIMERNFSLRAFSLLGLWSKITFSIPLPASMPFSKVCRSYGCSGPATGVYILVMNFSIIVWRLSSSMFKLSKPPGM